MAVFSVDAMTQDQQSDFEWLQLAAYMSGDASAEDRARVEQWLDADSTRRAEFERLRAAWTAGHTPVPSLDRARMWGEIVSATGIGVTLAESARDGVESSTSPDHGAGVADPRVSSQQVALRRVSRGGPASPTLWRRAVAATGVIAGLVVMFVLATHGGKPRDANAGRVYHTAAGERATISLVDGSRMVLGPSTTARVTADRSRGIFVSLNGQALFSVAHDPTLPFTVQAGSVVTRVLGTTFSVRHYDSDIRARILVADGRVAVQSTIAGAAPTILGAHMLGMVDSAGRVGVSADVPVERMNGWTGGQLVFDAVPVREALADLGRAYDVEFRVADSTLAKAALTWSVATNTVSLATALDELGEVLVAHFTRNGRVITIVRGHAASHRMRTPRLSLTPEIQYGR